MPKQLKYRVVLPALNLALAVALLWLAPTLEKLCEGINAPAVALMLLVSPITDWVGLSLGVNLDKFVFLVFVPVVWFLTGRWIEARRASVAKHRRGTPATHLIICFAAAAMAVLLLSIGVGTLWHCLQLFRTQRAFEGGTLAGGIMYLLWSLLILLGILREILPPHSGVAIESLG